MPQSRCPAVLVEVRAPAPRPCVVMEPLDSTPCWLPSLPAHFPEITSHELFTLRSSQEPSLRQEVPALFMRSDSGLLAAPGTGDGVQAPGWSPAWPRS